MPLRNELRIRVNRNLSPVRNLVPSAILLLLAACTSGEKNTTVYKKEFFTFGTIVSMSVSGVDEALAEKAFQVAEDDFSYMHTAWHPWQEGPTARINSLLPLGQPFSIAPSVKPLIIESTELFIKSGGLFNPAIGQLVKLWGFDQSELKQSAPPSDDAIQKVLAASPKMTDLSVNEFTLTNRNPSVLLDFGAFAKGRGIDMVTEHIKELGVHNAIVNAGGDLRAIGSKHGQPWTIGIRDPRGTGVIASVKVQGDESVFTSGDYERFFEHQGKRYHHIIDPRTGYPATGSSSITVMHQSAALADAAATALFVAGPDHWYETARQMGVKYVMLIAANGDVHMTPAMQSRMEFESNNFLHILISPQL